MRHWTSNPHPKRDENNRCFAKAMPHPNPQFSHIGLSDTVESRQNYRKRLWGKSAVNFYGLSGVNLEACRRIESDGKSVREDSLTVER